MLIKLAPRSKTSPPPQPLPPFFAFLACFRDGRGGGKEDLVDNVLCHLRKALWPNIRQPGWGQPSVAPPQE